MFSMQQRQLAAMAFNSYRPSDKNRIELKLSGSEIDGKISRLNRGDGFDATVFRSNTGQIVIAFRGTDGDTLAGMAADWDDSLFIGKGDQSDQVDHALEVTVAEF